MLRRYGYALDAVRRDLAEAQSKKITIWRGLSCRSGLFCAQAVTPINAKPADTRQRYVNILSSFPIVPCIPAPARVSLTSANVGRTVKRSPRVARFWQLASEDAPEENNEAVQPCSKFIVTIHGNGLISLRFGSCRTTWRQSQYRRSSASGHRWSCKSRVAIVMALPFKNDASSILISTRQLMGSRTPSDVCLSSCVLPLPTELHSFRIYSVAGVRRGLSHCLR